MMHPAAGPAKFDDPARGVEACSIAKGAFMIFLVFPLLMARSLQQS
jgi:hypothetical protein